VKVGFIVEGIENLKGWVPFAQKEGIDGVELFIWETLKGQKSLLTRVNDHRKMFQESGVELCAIGLWRINYLDKRPEVRQSNHEIFHQVIEYAASVGCSVVYTDTGELEHGNAEKNMAEFKSVFPSMNQFAKERGIQLGVYVGHPGNFINSRRILGWVYEQMPEVGFKLDPVGIIRNLKTDPCEVIKDYGDRIVHFHVKDILRMGGFEIEPPVGMGDLAWNKIMALLYHHGYQGYVCIEPHGPMWSRKERRAEHIILSKQYIEKFIVEEE